MIVTWYGADPCFWYPLETHARRELRERYVFEYSAEVLRYRVYSLVVPGDESVHDITIEFWRDPPYNTFGLLPQNYPRVFTNVVRPRKHAFDDDSLCIWHPQDAQSLRWTSDDGLLVLVEMIRRHLLLEIDFFFTGKWAIEDAPH